MKSEQNKEIINCHITILVNHFSYCCGCIVLVTCMYLLLSVGLIMTKEGVHIGTVHGTDRKSVKVPKGSVLNQNIGKK